MGARYVDNGLNVGLSVFGYNWNGVLYGKVELHPFVDDKEEAEAVKNSQDYFNWLAISLWEILDLHWAKNYAYDKG